MRNSEIISTFQWEPSDIISLLLLGSLFSWGLFLLYQRWIRQMEIPAWLDLLSLIMMLVILGIEIIQFRDWLKAYTILYILSSLGLFVSATALYAQSFISLVTTIFLSIIQPGEESAPDIPRFGPAEILERQKDYEGALNEYLILARIYPYHPSVYIHIANVFVKLNKPKEAMNWLEKSLKYLKKDEDVYLIIARYCDIAHELGDIVSESNMIDYYLNRYPNSIYSKQLVERKKQTREKRLKEKDKSVVLLEEQPLSMEQENINAGIEEKSGKIQLEKINANNNEGRGDEIKSQTSEKKKTSYLDLEPL